MKLAVIVVTLGAFACGKKQEVDACDAAGQQFAKVWQQTARDKSPNALRRVRNQLGGTCRGGMWDANATNCLRAIKSMDDAKACAAKFAADDREDFDYLLSKLFPAPADGCTSVAQHEVRLGNAQLDELVGDQRAHANQTLLEAAEALRTACEETTWSKDAIDCMNARSVVEDAKDCAQYFSQEQLAAFMKAIAPAGSAAQ
jgi:hypothetical protein